MHIILFVWTEVSWLSLTFFGPIFWSQDRSRAELVPVAEKETSFALKLNASHIQVEKVSWHNMGRGFTKTAKQRNSSQYRFKMLWTTFAFHEVHEASLLKWCIVLLVHMTLLQFIFSGVSFKTLVLTVAPQNAQKNVDVHLLCRWVPKPQFQRLPYKLTSERAETQNVFFINSLPRRSGPLLTCAPPPGSTLCGDVERPGTSWSYSSLGTDCGHLKPFTNHPCINPRYGCHLVWKPWTGIYI